MNRNTLLKELREYGIKNTVPNISDVNAKFLSDLINVKKAKNILEIGTANGFSAIHLGIAAEKNSGKVTSIELSIPSFAEAEINIKNAKLENTVKLIFGNALDEIPKLEEKFDFVFIDGMMRATKNFLGLVWNKVEIGGVIIIDDVIKFKNKMPGFKEFLKEYNISHNILPIDIDDGVMMIIKQDFKIDYVVEKMD
ncbi:MAG: class I SAM-dependent methyltransferase [Candidatus Gracilibacteria bacterium]|nr:class I SAM-dependent methyltransferase [Candidatus Gracilibacteria bacterium]